jgi:hypothetical protein
MKAHGTRLILGLITATVTAADEPVLHLHGMNKADNQGFRLVVSCDSWLVSGFEPLFGTRF